jgi:hypothetical protein
MMKALEAKVLFELNREGKVTIEVRGSKMAAKSGLLTIIERMAELDGSTTSELLTELSEVAKLKEENPIETILANLFGDLMGDIDEEDTCDGNCEQCQNHQEMPEELKNILDKMFGGSK